MLNFRFAKQHGVLLGEEQDKLVTFLHCQPITQSLLIELQRLYQKPCQFEQVSSEKFSELLSRRYATDSETALQIADDFSSHASLMDLFEALPKTADLMEQQDEAPIIRLLNALLHQAIKDRASDIHVESFADKLFVRFRIDGVLRIVAEPQRVLAPLIISRIKVMARLDIAEKRLPQDGRITVQVAGQPVDVRVSTLPTSHGERVVLRILDKRNARLSLSELGMNTTHHTMMGQLIAKPHGIILVTGPTGSGKTTTLYAALTALNQSSRNILTVEDPIEYDLPGVGQTQVNTKVDMSFAKGLRAILRQDPDVVMVGEIRDLETAQIAVQASLTGHLVLSTLHTNSAIGAIARLRDMGVPSYLLASSLVGVVAQRLVRALCQYCKTQREAERWEKHLLHVPEEESYHLYEAKGCDHCAYQGYNGRNGIYEIIAIDETLSTMIHDEADEQRLIKYAMQHYMAMRQDAFNKVRNGITTLEEVLRVIGEEK